MIVDVFNDCLLVEQKLNSVNHLSQSCTRFEKIVNWLLGFDPPGFFEDVVDVAGANQDVLDDVELGGVVGSEGELRDCLVTVILKN